MPAAHPNLTPATDAVTNTNDTTTVGAANAINTIATITAGTYRHHRHLRYRHQRTTRPSWLIQESVARKPETDVHATAHMSHISWGRAGPAVSIKNGAAADGDYDLVVVGSRRYVHGV